MGKAGFFTAAITASVVAYALYFDYSRRNSKEFRRKLDKAEKNYLKDQKRKEKKSRTEKLDTIKQLLVENLANDPLPTDLSQKEQFFMKEISKGEQYAASPGNETNAALAFYRAISTYPEPSSLLSVYQKTLPGDIYDIIVQMIAIRPPLAISNILGVDPMVDNTTD